MPLASSDNAVGRHGHASCIMVHVPWPWNVVVWLAAGARPAGGEKGGDFGNGPCASGNSRQNTHVLFLWDYKGKLQIQILTHLKFAKHI